MYLSRLEILGFKSFAQKTLVTFNQGVTGIVGPNGCGKTNIVDAIRWCLGEQRSGALRSDKMENVIFNGTASKKPMGMAEVSLTIVNNRGILPTEYSEVTITRRIFRSGESEYLLNKNICRLKDITNLFMDTGIGANAYSVIELKMVENILSSRTDERRTLFEEAAGVNKYKLRRRLSLKKLEDVKADLTRVNDIVSEVEKKVNSLERQAKKADKYNKISQSLRELELDLAEREMAYYTIQKEESKLKKDESFNNKISIESELLKLEDEIRVIRSQINEIEHQLKSKRQEVTQQTEKIYNIQRFISVNEERKKSLEKNITRYNQELEELHFQSDETEELIENSAYVIDEFAGKILSKQAEKNAVKDEVEQMKGVLEEKRHKLKEYSENLLTRFKEITKKENELSNLDKALSTKKNQINKLNERIQSLTGTAAKTVGFIEELNGEKTETEKKLEEAESYYLLKQREKEELEKQLGRLKEKELEDKSLINGIKDKIGFIQSLIDNLEGVSKGAKALIENSDWSMGDKTLLAHIGNSSEEYRFAIEASLKANLNNILVESLEDLKNGISYLKNNDIGKASFYIMGLNQKKKSGILEKVQTYIEKRKIRAISKEEGFLGWSYSFVETDSKWKPFFENILQKTAVVKDLSTAFELHEKYELFNFATLNGDYIDNKGIVEGGSAPKLDDSLFGRKQLLENLKNEFPKREEQLLILREEIEKTEEFISLIDLKVLSEKGRLLVNDLANIEKQIAQFEFEMKKALDETEKARNELQELAAESNKLDNERNRVSELLESELEERRNADQEKEVLETEFKEYEKSYSGTINNQNRINLELERLSGERKNAENALERAQNTIISIKKTIEKREFDITTANEEADSIKELIEEKILDLDELEADKKKLIKEEGEIDTAYKLLRSSAGELESKQTKLRKERDVLSDLIHSAEIKLNELNMKMTNLQENIKEDYSVTIEKKEFDDLDVFDFKQRIEEVHSLKQQVKNLGPINLLAYTEFAEEKERMEFLQKQRNDLLDSEKDIIRTIEEINTTAQTLFMDTFEKIRGHFVNIFRGLFNPGDEADLKLEENADPLEAKIEIIAKPKGKRPTGIELLSGGEKTLTAIALLFAIYLVKPSPFCILDEVDAPLDDANIDRYSKIIKEFSNDTQFIMVTHNKRTMESADTLYGVTMQEEGISKLVSVQFNEELNFVS